jgi:A/G-specific adenine glycosylase
VRELCAWRAAGHPPDQNAARRRVQAWHGTDRQVRGRVMAVLRGATGPVHRGLLAEVGNDGAQVDRCLAGLVEDGLVEQGPDGRYALPTSPAGSG